MKMSDKSTAIFGASGLASIKALDFLSSPTWESLSSLGQAIILVCTIITVIPAAIKVIKKWFK